LLDADIRLAPGMLAALQRKADEGYALVSLCAEPCWHGLAARVKRKGYRCWIGLTHGATSQRRANFQDIARMIARTAFVQLRESLTLTLAVSALLIVAFWMPVLALAFDPTHAARAIGLLALLAMLACYLPTLMYYRRNLLAALLLPLAATFFLAATWYSAWRASTGTRSVWKGRRYQRGAT
jgi:uncharacterized membrane protein YhaH (DUF805 family)